MDNLSYCKPYNFVLDLITIIIIIWKWNNNDPINLEYHSYSKISMEIWVNVNRCTTFIIIFVSMKIRCFSNSIPNNS